MFLLYRFFGLRLSIVTVFTSLTFLLSCTTEDHDIPEARSCRYLGSNTHEESNQRSAIRDEETRVALDDAGKLLVAEYNTDAVYKNSTGAQSGADHRKYEMTYDKNGFLIKQINTNIYNSKTKGGWSYGDFGPYYELNIETIATTIYQYENEKLISEKTVAIETLTGDNSNKRVSESSRTKTYEYNDATLAKTIETSSTGNYVLTTFTPDGSYVQTNQSGTSVTTYDAKTRTTIVKAGAKFEYRLKFDAHGNLVSSQRLEDGQLVFTELISFDTNKNPQTLIPTIFKGIPRPLTTIHTSEGINNMTKITTTTEFGGNKLTTISKLNHVYNSSGYPIRTDWENELITGVDSRSTTYNYENCP